MKLADRSDKAALENGLEFAPKFDARGLIPVVTTCAATGRVLMQAWMDADAIAQTIKTGEAHYFSRSRQTLWHKGATSGEFQVVKDFRTDCDQDSLWLVVDQKGGKCCHVGHPSCFYRSIPLGQAVDNGEVVKLADET